MPHVDSYRFGHITINGESHTNDVKCFPDEVKPNWWRDEGHLLQPSDIEDVLERGPDVLIVGQGNSARMKIAPKTKEVLSDHEIELKAMKTQDAVETYNEADSDVIGAFHLTC